MSPPGGPWIVSAPFSKAPPLRLFCFPYAGGGASVYRGWSARLRPFGIEVCAVQLPGRENRISEPRIASLRSLAGVTATALEPWFDRPFSFFGHSLGALLGFEIARELRRRGQPSPRHLFVSAARAPHLPRTETPIHQLPDGPFVDELGKRYGGIPAEILAEEELMALLLPTLRADLTAFETYRHEPEPPLDVPICALGGAEDPRVQPAHLEAWRQHTTRDFALRIFPGDHFFLNTASAEILSLITQILHPSASPAAGRAAGE